jgi:hypothetical protein
MVFTDRDVTEIDEKLLTFDISDDALERVVSVADGRAQTWIYSTEVAANCGCPCASDFTMR